MKQTFVIPGRLTGLNEYIDACRRNRYAGAKIKKEAHKDICFEIKRQRVKRFKNPVSVNITWIEPNMKRDKDNISFAKKFILDSLVEMQIIKDDGWKWVGNLSDQFLVNRSNPRIIVTLDDEL